MLNHFNFQKFANKVLLTNDFGKYIFLDEAEFKGLLMNKITESDYCYRTLKERYFLMDHPLDLFSDECSIALRGMKNYLFSGTALHIFAITNACNMSCIYCQAKDKSSTLRGYMTPDIGKRAIEVALQSPCHNLTFEFQGGEPLLNFDTIKTMIEHCEKIKGDKNVEYTMVSNLIALTDDRLDYLTEHHVSVSTSMDGPRHVHDYNRGFAGGAGSYDYMEKGLEQLKQKGICSGAIETTTRYSLSYPTEIVDAYYEHGLSGIFLRPLTPLGFAQADWDRIGYTPDEYLTFYRQAFERILEINQGEVVFPELLATYFLKKILHGRAANYMELRSPCGASLGQMSYYYDGNVYTCDEGRMVSESGIQVFCLGNIFQHTYQELIENPVCKATAVSSVVEGLPLCSDCVYHPYCGVCPVVTYALEKDIFPRLPGGFRCMIYHGILDMLFTYIRNQDEDVIKIFKSWTGGDSGEMEK